MSLANPGAFLSLACHPLRSKFPNACVGLTVFLLMLSGCAPAGLYKSEKGRGAGENTLRLHYWPDESVLGPSIGMPAFALVFCPPFSWDDQGEVQGWLVKSWEHSADYQTWTYRLHPDVRWHDGVPMTAQDVEFTMRVLSHPDVLGIKPDSFDFKIIDDLTYSITYKDKSVPPLNDYTFFFPKHLLQDQDPADFEEWDFWTHPIGNGPYRYVRHMPKTMVELEANPDYFRGKPRIETVILLFAGNKLTELLAGNVDAFWETQVFDLKGREDYRSYFKTGGYAALNWNHKSVFFEEPQVRLALTLAVNRRELFRLRGLPDEVPIADAPLTRRQIISGDIPEPLPHDPIEAGRLLDEAGWIDHDGDGVRDREGQDFNFTLILTANAQNVAVYIQDQLRRIGVRMEIQPLAPGVVRSRYDSGDYEAVLYRGGNLAYYVDSGSGPSPTGYHSARLQQAWEAFQSDFEPESEERLFVQAWEIFQQDVPAVFLVPGLYQTVAHKKIKGLRSPDRVWPEWHMEHLWIEDEK